MEENALFFLSAILGFLVFTTTVLLSVSFCRSEHRSNADSPSTLPVWIYHTRNLGLSSKTGVRQKIAKTGSLCCVAARPHESNAASAEWSLGPHEPYWRTNTSYSPPPSRWDFRFQFDGLPYGLPDTEQLYDSSGSSNSKDSRGLLRGNQVYNNHLSVSDFGSDTSQAPQWTPPTIQEISAHYDESTRRRGRDMQTSPFAPASEDTSTHQENLGSSSSSRSDSSESEHTSRSRLPTHHRNTSSCRFFISKPIHPLSFPLQSPAREESSGFTASLDLDAATAPHRDTTCRLSSATSSSLDYTDMSELQFEAETSGSKSCNLSSDVYKCGSCGRFLSQRSPWSSRRIVRTGDLPVSGVLPCHHVFHAECLEQSSSKLQKQEPPCPVCTKLEEDQRLFNNRLGSGFPRLRPFPEDGPSKTWACRQVGDCVEGALHASPRNSVMLLNRNRLKKNLSMKGNLPGKVKRGGLDPK